jgi:hypothetical protein
MLLEVTITAGSTAGQRVRVNRSPAAFGRDADNALVIDLPTASRVHGELRLDDGQWVVANLSPNGTLLNRRPIGRRPRPLADGDQVVIGNQPVLTVALRPSDDAVAVEVAEPEEIGAAPAAPPKQKMSARMKLWMTIFGFWAVVILAAVFFKGGAETADAGPDDLPLLTEAQIAASIREPYAKHDVSPRNAVEHLEEADAAYQSINADPKNAFRAFHGYKTALSYAFGERFTDPRDDWGGKAASELAVAENRYLQLQQQLIEDVTRLYEDAAGKLQDGRLAEARRGFEAVYRLYADSSSEVYRNAQRQRDLARRRLAARN